MCACANEYQKCSTGACFLSRKCQSELIYTLSLMIHQRTLALPQVREEGKSPAMGMTNYCVKMMDNKF